MPYGRHSIDESDVEAVLRVLRGDWLTTGPAVTELEDLLAARCGAAGAVAVTSGTAALHTAYAAAGVGPGCEVVTSPLTFVATASTAVLLGATVRFADVEEDTGCLSVDAAAAEVGSATAVVAGVDYAGVPVDAEGLGAVAHAVGALLLEDAAHSLGSTRGGRPVGSLADLTTTSFFATKNVTSAEGGAVLSGDRALLEAARRFRNHGLVREREHQRWPDEGPWHQEVHALGLNYRLPDVLAALGASQLRRLDAFVARRAAISARYDAGLADAPGLRLPHRPAGADTAWHLYPLRVLDGQRRRVLEGLRARGIGAQVNYVPAYWHPWFADAGYARGLCPAAERWYAEELSLPLHVGMGDEDVDRVVEVVRDLVAG